MGRHDVGEDGMSYSLIRKIERDEKDVAFYVTLIRRKCFRIVMHSGTHVAALLALHVVSVAIYYNIPFLTHA